MNKPTTTVCDYDELKRLVHEFCKGQEWASKPWKDQPHVKPLFEFDRSGYWKNNCTEPDRASCPRLCQDFCNQAEAREPGSQNLDATVFVFRSTRKPHKTHVVYIDQASNYADRQKWKHTATLNPAAWIEHLMNNPSERNEQIEQIGYRLNEKCHQ